MSQPPAFVAPRVVLIDHTKDPDLVCAAAAKICYEPEEWQRESGKFLDFEGMLAWLRDERPDHVAKVLRFALGQEPPHESIVEHAHFTFYFEGVSRSLLAQLTRHRIASYTIQSQRYVDLQDATFVTPPAIARNPQAAAEYAKVMEEIWHSYDRLRALKVGKQDARYVLPNACTTRGVVTFNARSLLNFFDLRLDRHAQWEIRYLANEMLRLVKPVAALLFERVEVLPVEAIIAQPGSIATGDES